MSDDAETIARLTRENAELRRRLGDAREPSDLPSGVELELRRQEQRLRLILDGVRDHAISMLDPEGRVQTFNAPAERIKGYPLAEVQGRYFGMFFTPEDRAAGLPETELATARATGRYEGEGWRLRKDGSRFYAAVSLSALHDPSGELVGFVKVTQDRTRYRELEDEARITETIYRIGTVLAAGFDLDTIFARLTDEATALCRAQFGAFFYNVTRPEGGSYMLYTLSGVPRERFAGFPMPRNTAIFAPTFAGAGTVRSDDITRDARYGKSAPYHGMPRGHLPVRSYLAVPVVGRTGEVHGGLFFGHEEPGVFTEKDERMLVAVAAQAAVAIDNARLHAATQAAEEQYRVLAEASPQLIWTTTAAGAVEYCNRRFLSLVGLSLDEMRSGPAWDRIVHPQDAPRAAAAWAQAVAAGEPYEVEYRLRRAVDGSYLWFLARGAPVRDGDGRVTRWVGSCTDIDDRKRTEETHRFLAEAGALLASSLDYRATLPTLARLAVPGMADWCAIDLLDDAGSLERLAVAHADPGRVDLVREVHRLYPPDPDRGAGRVLRTGEPLRAREITEAMLAAHARDPLHLELIRELGLRSWMAAPVVVQRRVVGVIEFASAESGRLFEARDLAVAEELGRRAGVVIDNARLFEMIQRERLRAEEASRAKDELLSITSHELRTPLNAILGWSHLLQGGALGEAQRARAVETIERNARVQVKLVDDLLDFSRVVTGRLRLSLAPVDPARVVEAAVEVVRPAADARNVRLQVLLDPDAGTLNGDAGRLQQVVWNLLSNAVKFTPRGGRVYIRLRREDSHVEVVVGDTGAGIDPAFLPHVFQPFRQQDATITRTHGGLGLGLAIVKHLVELHGGTVEARSDGPGKGATFVVRLPVAPLRSEHPPAVSALAKGAARPEASPRCPPELAGLRILICEDEPDARELLEAMFVDCKATVALAGSVREALDRFAESAPDVLVSDIGMPDASGYELIRRIRELPPERGGLVPAIALTAYASMSDRTRALMEGFQNHVAKPTDPRELLAAVAALAGQRARTGR